MPKSHPLRPIREMINAALTELDADFNVLYSVMWQDSILPEKLLRAQSFGGVLHDPHRTATSGAGRFQPAIPLVRGHVDGGCGMEPLHLH